MPKFVKVSDSKLPIEELHLGFLNYKLRNEFGFLESSKNNMPLNNKGEIIPMYTYPCYEYLNSIDWMDFLILDLVKLPNFKIIYKFRY